MTTDHIEWGFNAALVPGLTGDEQRAITRMCRQWAKHEPKNQLIDVYYDGHRAFQDLGISVPPSMRSTRAALDWPAKAVKALARKHVFEGYSLKGSTDPLEVGEVLARNGFDAELMQAINAAYRHGVSFLTVSASEDPGGVPVVEARDARWMTALWDRRRRCLSAALAVTDVDDQFVPSAMTMWTRDDVIVCERDSRGAWVTDRITHGLGRVLVEPLVHDPQIHRPFGHSRISREVRYLTDAAVRTLVRTETSAEFFSSPQRYVLGADEQAFEGYSRWTAIQGRILALEANENGDIPSVGQFPQMSMEPHLSMYRQLAQNFCAATGLPQSSVGLFADNPQSAEAMLAAEAGLAAEADLQWRIFQRPLLRVVEDIVMLRDRLTAPPPEAWRMSVKWTPTTQASTAAQADYISKVVAALPQVADTTVALRLAGLTTEQIDEIRAERQRAAAGSVLDRLLATDTAGGETQ